MNQFNRCNKHAGVWWLKNQIENLNIRIKLQPQDSITLLPKLEDYVTNPSPRLLETPAIQEYTFKWQQKVFSQWEIQRYSDVHNCLSETELKYHDMLQSEDYEPSTVFSYIHEDYHAPLPSTNKKVYNNNLTSCFQRLKITDSIDSAFSASSMSRLFRSEDNLVDDDEQWTAMHVVFDKSDYDENSQLLLKQEALLLSLYYNSKQNYLVISPDVNDLELNPYSVEPLPGVQWGFKYGVEVEFEEEGGTELLEFLNKLNSKWESKHSELTKFSSPEFDKKRTQVSFEILTATGFDNDDCYVEFTIKIPDLISYEGPIHGRTHSSRKLTGAGGEVWHYGHAVDLQLDMDADLEPKPLLIYLEMISTDWWGRHRTEGYSCLALSLRPGYFSDRLSCLRPEEDNQVAAEERRFFVGGCNLVKELEVLSEPQSYDTNFKLISTGTITVRWSTISQGYIAGLHTSTPEPRGGSSTDLLRGAEAVLRKYKVARARLEAVTRDLGGEEAGG